VDAVRGIGLVVLLLGATGVLTRFGRSFKFYPGANLQTGSFYRWSGRFGVALVGLGVLLILISTL
jgi:hypothetical protein